MCCFETFDLIRIHHIVDSIFVINLQGGIMLSNLNLMLVTLFYFILGYSAWAGVPEDGVRLNSKMELRCLDGRRDLQRKNSDCLNIVPNKAKQLANKKTKS